MDFHQKRAYTTSEEARNDTYGKSDTTQDNYTDGMVAYGVEEENLFYGFLLFKGLTDTVYGDRQYVNYYYGYR